MIRVNFAGASIVEPGSYSDVTVAESSLAQAALGVVALIGEADEGAAFAAESGLSAVSFGPEEFSAIVEKFGSGPLVDAAKLAIAPSNDPQIRGGAQELILIKTNASTTAQLAVPQGASTYGTLKAKRAGQPGNNVSYACSIVSDKAIITLTRLDTGVTEVSDALGGNAVMTIQCTDGSATAATITINGTSLTTAITGGTAAPLNLQLKNFGTIKALCDYISAQSGYAATPASAALGAQSPAILDQESAANILVAKQIMKDAYEVQQFFAASSLVTWAPAIKKGLPTTKAKSYLTGGARGASLAADVVNGIDALMARRVNFIVPLFSRDAAADVADGLTDASSTYDIEAIHAAVGAHCNLASSIKGRKERQAFVGFKASSLNACAERSAEINSPRVALCVQDVDCVSASSGEIESMQPHMLAAINAGMRASALPGLPMTFKSPNIVGFSHPDFDPETQAEKALVANICFVERAPSGGFRFKLDNSTYASDKDAWVYNRPAVLGAADLAAYTIRLNTEQFVGQRNSDVSEETVKNLLVTVMDNLKAQGIIVADAKNQGRGYKDLSVKIKGSIVEISVTLTLVEGLEFILSSIKVQRTG